MFVLSQPQQTFFHHRNIVSIVFWGGIVGIRLLVVSGCICNWKYSDMVENV